MRNWLTSASVLTAVTTTAMACPVCNTDTGQQVRAGIMDGNFGVSLLATLLPFAVVLGVVAIIQFGLPGTWDKHGDRD